MRVWDLPLVCLCDLHLRAEHNEIHTIWNEGLGKTTGWQHHPEIKRWKGHLIALWVLHMDVELEMVKRGMKPKSPLEITELVGHWDEIWGHRPEPWQSVVEQKELLVVKRGSIKGCACMPELLES